MSSRFEKETETLVLEGFELGIAPSPHKGVANIQNANLSTEIGEVVASFQRVQQSQVAQATGTLTASVGLGSFNLASNVPLQVGTWISISASSITSLGAGTYYVSEKNSNGYLLSLYYDPNVANSISHGTSGTATFSTTPNLGQSIASATEVYSDGTNTQYRYYILDSAGLVWVYDTLVYSNSLALYGFGTTWFLPDASTTYFQTAYSTVAPTGIAILNGWLMVFGGHRVWAKPTVNLGDTTSSTTTYAEVLQGGLVPGITTTGTVHMGDTSATLSTTWVFPTGVYSVTFSNSDVRDVQFTASSTGISWTSGLSSDSTDVLTLIPTLYSPYSLEMLAGLASTIPHFAFVGHQGRCYYTDGSFIGEIFPNSALQGNANLNIQSFCSYTSSSTNGTIATVISGTMPSNGSLPTSGSFERIPAIFFPSAGGSNPTTLAQGVVYYINCSAVTGLFQVYTLPTGGTALDISTGKSGTLYFNTFYPISAAATSSASGTVQYAPQALFLPTFEVATTIGEIGNLAIIGCKSNSLYPWNQFDITPSSTLQLPETNTAMMINVHNMMYVFAGYKGNIYITDGSVVSHVYSVPDYCAGVPGTPTSYIEPYFTWGGAMYLRGRVYFSLLDQTSTKAGNCGGIWSFVPTQNYFIQQDVGISLVLENQNSYGSYNGTATVLIPNQQQNAIAPQYWSGWYSSVSTPLYGIDYTGTFPNGTVVVESDLVPTGTLLGEQKKIFNNIEFKLASPMVAGESVAINYRLNATDSWATAGTIQYEGGSATGQLSGYISPLQISSLLSSKGQWIQLQGILTNNGTSTFSGNRLKEFRIR